MILFGRMILIGLALFLAGQSAEAAMVRPPWLQAATPTSVYVLVEAEEGAPVRVEYGRNEGLGLTAGPESTESTIAGRTVRNIKLTGLSPGQRYFYRAVGPKRASEVFSFKTSARPGRKVRFAWIADTRKNPEMHDRIAGLVLEARPDFVLNGGDLVSSGRSSLLEDDHYEAWEEEFFVANQSALIARTPFYLAPGNHEGWTGLTKAFVQAPDGPSGTQDYYSFDSGDVHILVLNTELDLKPGSRQYGFAAADLAGSKAEWKIVAVHKPGFASGSHGGNREVARLAHEVLHPNGADLVLSGHNHYYQHNLVDGVRHVVMGSAGVALKTPEPGPFVVKSAKSHNFGLVEAGPGFLDLTVLDENGRQIDRIHLQK